MSESNVPPNAPGTSSPNWQQQVIDKFAFAALDEQRRARRWGIFFKLLGFAYLLLIFFAFRSGAMGGTFTGSTKPHTALVDINGVIAPDSEASADNIVGALRSAFENDYSEAVILRINSPGGSPVQAGYVNDEIVRLRAKYPDKKLYAVISDICASGGYYIAAAADEIYADKGSIVGSIGVLMDGFGFTGTMEKLGVERRLLTAGEDKGFLDPFSPQKPEELGHAKELLNEIHQQFINTVKRGRGARLKEDPKLFSGLIWTGVQAVELGLVDALGSASFVARDVVKAEDIVDYTSHEPYIDRLAKRFGAAMAESLAPKIQLR
jgi:protease-4